MITISLCLIVKDEQDTLDRYLSSVTDLVEEIIIVEGFRNLAYEHNEAAHNYRPGDARVLQNKAYLEGILRIQADEQISGGTL